MSCSSSGSSWSSSGASACSPARPARASRSCSTRWAWRWVRVRTRRWSGPVRIRHPSRRRSSFRAGIPPPRCFGEQGIVAEPGEPLIVRRTVKSDGGSRAFIGGASVPAGVLRDFGALAVEIHGQHDDRGLLNPKGHRALLDAFGKLDTAKVEARLGRGHPDRGRAARCAGGCRRQSATVNGSNMLPAKSRRSRPKKARRRGSPRSARRCRRASRPVNC